MPLDIITTSLREPNTNALNQTPPDVITLQLRPAFDLTDEQFFQFCQINRELKIEMTAKGELIIMPPTGADTGSANFRLLGQLYVWMENNNQGIGFDSSTGFVLPNGAKRSPDAAWIRLERWQTLTPEQHQKFAPLCPDFVGELRSTSDQLSLLQGKMQEYMDNGAQLGWLIDRSQRQVYIYRPGIAVACLEQPISVSGDPVLPGFVLNLTRIW